MSDHNESNAGGTAAPELIRQLLTPAAFPEAATRPEMIETHISWVILAGDYAYKIKKPVDLGFVDFSTLERRKHFCDEELRLNKRFAPSLYLDVVPIGGSTGNPRIGQAPPIEWAVRMRRFAADAGLDHQVARDRVSAADLREFGGTLAAIHARAELAADPAYGALDSIRGPALDNFSSLQRDCPGTPEFERGLATLRDWTVARADALVPMFAERVADGRIRECHGDLHLGNMVRLDDACVAFDCLEFDPALRWIDVISDVGFLVMDLLRVERADLACEFLNRYLEIGDDYRGLATLPFYVVYRALVRAKTTAVRVAQQGAGGDFTATLDYLEFARRMTERASAPLLVICHGLSGSGKTWISNGLIAALPALRVRSDIVRKHLHGLAERDSSGAALNAGLYGRDAKRRTYEQVAVDAALCLQAGFDVIVDTTSLLRVDREHFEVIAADAGAATAILHCVADQAVLEARVRDRHAAGTDASEAGVEVLLDQLHQQEPLTPAELDRTVVVDSGPEPDFVSIARALRRCAMR